MIARILVEITNKKLDKTFDYLVPNKLENNIKIGIRVKVPFNNRVLEGFVLDIVSNTIDNYNLKEIIELVDSEPILNEELLGLGKYMSKKYFSTLISCYQTMLPSALKAKNSININKKYIKYIKLNKEFDINIIKNDKQYKIIELLKKKDIIEKKELESISKSSLKTLINNKVVIEILKEDYRLKLNDLEKTNKFKLTNEQEKAKNIILNSEDSIYLLNGVTASGKTVVYLEIVEEMLKMNKQSIFLVPEISLTPQMVTSFRNRFGSLVAVLHSRLSPGEKYDEYRKIKSGSVKIVVGARSAVFAPFDNIGVIIIDEEHTTTYKQDNNPKYNAIDIAIERIKYHNAKLILGSATPSLDSYARAIKGIYKLVEMPSRVNNKKLPEVEIIDMNEEYKKTGIFSKKLIDSLNYVLSKHEQAILLLNRRGYSSFVMCSNCGNTIKCPNCDITLTYHKSSNTLRCHYCGYADKKIDICPNCKEKSMKALGVGTEKVEEELNKIINARVVRMDLDTTVQKGSHEKIIKDFREGKYDILLGTQMISKGLDFNNVTLVGVINADTSLLIPNYKSSELTFDLLMQTAGRSGRSENEGKVLIQTFNKDHYAISLVKEHNYLEFFKKEMETRRKLSYPPYYFLTYVRIIGNDYELTSSESNKIGKYIKQNLSNSIILGPTICSVFRINNKYRFGIVIKYKKEDNLYKILNNVIDHYKNNNKITIDIDINPNNF